MFAVLNATGSINLCFRRQYLHHALADISVGSINNSLTKLFISAGREQLKNVELMAAVRSWITLGFLHDMFLFSTCPLS